tara:strand:+ start:3183 stop:3389 length:207 start_codon:yes stop_codon:yes gene_type:complete
MEEPQFKTSSYQRKAYKDYIARKKDDPIFKEKLRENQKKYYQKNKEKILARKKAQREANKASSSEESD